MHYYYYVARRVSRHRCVLHRAHDRCAIEKCCVCVAANQNIIIMCVQRRRRRRHINARDTRKRKRIKSRRLGCVWGKWEKHREPCARRILESRQLHAWYGEQYAVAAAVTMSMFNKTFLFIEFSHFVWRLCVQYYYCYYSIILFIIIISFEFKSKY